MEDEVRNLLAAIEADDMNTAMSYLSSDFQLSGPVPEPIGAREWLGLHHALNQGMPDFSFNLKEVRADGNRVYTTVQISGTQTNDLDLSAMGMGIIPATGAAVQQTLHRPAPRRHSDPGSSADSPAPAGAPGEQQCAASAGR